jgi:thymidine kinase
LSKLYFRYAAMNAGKSTALLQAAYNYEERGMRVRMFTAAHDDRTGVGLIGSRLGLQRQAETFGADTQFDAEWLGEGIACLLIDEAQFLSPDQVRQLHRLAHQHPVPVLCYGPAQRLSRRGLPWRRGPADAGRRPGRDEDHLRLRAQGQHEPARG